MRRAIGALLLLSATFARADLVTLDKPLYAEVYLKSDGSKSGKVAGNLISYDDTLFTLHVGKDDRQLSWADITPASAFTLRQRVTDKNSAEQMFQLGLFGLKLGAREQSIFVLRTAARLDPKRKSEIDNLIATSSSVAPTTAPAADKTAPLAIQASKPSKYKVATPEEHAQAIAKAKERAQKVADELNLKFTSFETDHFLVFTDWDLREYSFLKTNLESAYTCVSKQFDMSPKDNIFIGKLPIYMFAKYSDFAAFGAKDEFPVNDRVMGYFQGDNSGVGHMSMWKPNEKITDTNNIEDAKRLWAYVLTHEFTHAFLARYRSNAFIPRWLNEGIAEVIASSQFPYPDRRERAKSIAYEGRDVSFLFDNDQMPGGEYYPVMQTMVEMLISANKKKFLSLIDTIKEGTDPEAALKQIYNTDYAGVVKTWREWVKRQ